LESQSAWGPEVSITVETSDDSTTLRLEGTIDIASAAELKATLVNVLETGMPIRLSLAAQADLDVTAIQLLWAAEREASASGVEFRLGGKVPDALFAAVKEAGFERFPVPE
jgi:anti-anti-sigma regulatory factor